MNDEIGFYYGICEDTLETQARNQGYTLGDKAESLEGIRHAITLCGFHVATQSQVNTMTSKLHKKVIASLSEYTEGE